MLAPARIPVAAGKKTANMVKKLLSTPSYGWNDGPKLSLSVDTVNQRVIYITIHIHVHCTTSHVFALVYLNIYSVSVCLFVCPSPT